jgi:hypothetical protein
LAIGHDRAAILPQKIGNVKKPYRIPLGKGYGEAEEFTLIRHDAVPAHIGMMRVTWQAMHDMRYEGVKHVRVGHVDNEPSIGHDGSQEAVGCDDVTQLSAIRESYDIVGTP